MIKKIQFSRDDHSHQCLFLIILKYFFQVVIAGRNNVTVGKGSQRGEKLYLHYAQRWAKDYLRRRLDWVVEDYYGTQDFSSNTSPRHIKAALCPCQVHHNINIHNVKKLRMSSKKIRPWIKVKGKPSKKSVECPHFSKPTQPLPLV